MQRTRERGPTTQRLVQELVDVVKLLEVVVRQVPERLESSS